MKFLLLGGLAAAFAALLAVGADRLAARRQHARGEEVVGEGDEDGPPPSAPPQSAAVVRRLPVIPTPPACTPLPGQACLVGRVRISGALQAAWRARLAARHAAASAAAEGEEPSREDENDSNLPEDDDNLANPASLYSLFVVRATRLVKTFPPALSLFEPVAAAEAPHSPSAPDDDVHAQVGASGIFHMQLPPGRYALEAAADEESLVGGIDDIEASPDEVLPDLDLAVSESVDISARFVDADGVGQEEEIAMWRDHQTRVTHHAVGDDGRFVLTDLRAGTYWLATTTGGVLSPPVQVHAPSANVELRASPRARGLLLVGRDPDGSCPGGRVILSPRESRHRRAAHFVGCQAIVVQIRPGSGWTITGRVGSHVLNQSITFDASKGERRCG